MKYGTGAVYNSDVYRPAFSLFTKDNIAITVYVFIGCFGQGYFGGGIFGVGN